MKKWPSEEAFTAHYAEASGVTVEKLAAWGLEARPCDCGEEGCKGWRMDVAAVKEPTPWPCHAVARLLAGDGAEDTR